jgi:recombination protein RecT
MTEIQRVPKLIECSPESLISGFWHASQCGLEICSHLGQCWLLPFRNHGRMEAVFTMGYKGLVALAYRSGMIQNVQAWDVRQGDDYRPPVLGTDPKIVHTPMRGREGKALEAAYAVVRLRGSNFPNIEWMWDDELQGIMRQSKSAASSISPWKSHFEMMCRKTVLKRVCKYVPQTPETRLLHTSVAVDDQADANVGQAFDVPPELIADAEVFEGKPMHDPATGELSADEEARMERETAGQS